MWVLFPTHSATLCLLVGAFKSLTFKMIIDRYICSAIVLLDLFLCFLKDFIYLFLEREKGREKERETSICGWLLCTL